MGGGEGGEGGNGAALAANTAAISANDASDFLVHSPTDPAQGVVVAEFDPAVFEGKSERICGCSKCLDIVHSVLINYCFNSIEMAIHSSSANHLLSAFIKLLPVVEDQVRLPRKRGPKKSF